MTSQLKQFNFPNLKRNLASLFIVISLVVIPNSVAFADYGIQTKTSKCVSSAVPDSACTPGAIFAVNKSTICVSGYTKKVRDVSTAIKKQVFKEYGISWNLRSNYEVDHLISLELGGSNDISNLWPESYKIKNGATSKDQFENYLHKQVCNGSMTLSEAQRQISTNWMTNYAILSGSPKTSTSTSNTSTTQTSDPAVKKSTSGICHQKGTTYYTRTLTFTPYNSIKECLNSGGRLPN